MFTRYPVLNLPPAPPPPPPPNLGCGGGETRCKSKKNKESPPWVCEKCAKKTEEATLDFGMGRAGIGCGYEPPEEVGERPEDVIAREKGRLTSEATLDLGCEKCGKKKKNPNETSEATLDLGRHDIGCPGPDAASVEAEGETSEATLDLGCDKCQKGKKRRKKAREQFNNFPSGLLNLQGPMLRQVPIAGQQMGTEYVYEDTEEATLDFGMGNGLNQVPLIGDGRAGKSVPYWRSQEEVTEATLDYGVGRLGQAGMLGQVPLVGQPLEEVSEATLDYGVGPWKGGTAHESPLDYGSGTFTPPPRGVLRGNGMLGQVRIVGMGNGGRGGRSVPLDEAEERDAGLMGQARKRCTGRHGYLGQAGQSYGCPAQAPGLDPTLNCQRDARGNAVCSNGMYFPPGCPHTPPDQYFSPGIAPDEIHNGILEAKVPAPRAAGTAGGEGAGGAAAPAATSPSTNVLPIAAGGIAAVGLLYAIFR